MPELSGDSHTAFLFPDLSGVLLSIVEIKEYLVDPHVLVFIGGLNAPFPTQLVVRRQAFTMQYMPSTRRSFSQSPIPRSLTCRSVRRSGSTLAGYSAGVAGNIPAEFDPCSSPREAPGTWQDLYSRDPLRLALKLPV
jgi:hypothetical protein